MNNDIRVNPTTPTHRFATKKLPNTATGPSLPISKDEYDGKELRSFAFRPGSMDFKKCPSRGF